MIRKINQKFASGNFILTTVIITNQKEAGIVKNYKEYIALWDTGANKSVISPKVVRDLNLQSEGQRKNQTPNAVSVGNIYNVNFLFPKSDINFLDVYVSDGIKTDFLMI